MVLWSEYRVAFLGPAVCLWLADNDIMTDERADIKWPAGQEQWGNHVQAKYGYLWNITQQT